MIQIKFDETKKIYVFANILQNICKTFNFKKTSNKPFIVTNTFRICVISSGNSIDLSVRCFNKLIKIKK